MWHSCPLRLVKVPRGQGIAHGRVARQPRPWQLSDSGTQSAGGFARGPLVQSGGMTTALEAFRAAAAGRHVIGWKLAAPEREALLAALPPRYPRVVADHVTLKAHVARDAALPDPTVGVIVGRSDDGRGVEALVVQLDGATGRPDGSTYHITWSLDGRRRAVESNDVIRDRGWEPLVPPRSVQLFPAVFP